MLPLAACLAVALAGAPLSPSGGAAIMVSRRTNVSVADANSLALQVSATLRDLGVPIAFDPDAAAVRLDKLGVTDTAACAGRTACITELGQQLKAAWVIAISVAEVDGDRSVALDLIRSSDGSILERDALVLAPRAKATSRLLEGFAQRCRSLIKATDAPIVNELTPVTRVRPRQNPQLVEAPPEPKSHTTALILGGAAVVAVAAAATLFAMSLSARDELSKGTASGDVIRSELMGSDAITKNDSANLELGLAGVAAGVGVAFGTAAVITW